MVIRYDKERTDTHLDSASPRTNMFIPPNSEVSISDGNSKAGLFSFAFVSFVPVIFQKDRMRRKKRSSSTALEFVSLRDV